MSQNRHSTHHSVTFSLPSCQNSHRTYRCDEKKYYNFLSLALEWVMVSCHLCKPPCSPHPITDSTS
nr:MAG TPA_asm: hypothetical protein [Caudoviricetes sp.]